jgi:hypothetical protein
LATETRAIPLSDRLFRPDGLFSQLADTEEDRRIVAQSSLFSRAQRRITELQKKELAEFAKTVSRADSAFPEEGYRFKLERVDGR